MSASCLLKMNVFVLPQDKNSTDINSASFFGNASFIKDVALINSFPSLLSLLSWWTLMWHLLPVLCNGRTQCIPTPQAFLPISLLFVKWLLLDFHFSSLWTPTVYLWNFRFIQHVISMFIFLSKDTCVASVFWWVFLTSRCWAVLRKFPLNVFGY